MYDNGQNKSLCKREHLVSEVIHIVYYTPRPKTVNSHSVPTAEMVSVRRPRLSRVSAIFQATASDVDN